MAIGKEIDFEKVPGVVVWKKAEQQATGAVVSTGEYVLYPVVDPKPLREFLAAHPGAPFPTQDRLRPLLSGAILLCRRISAGELMWETTLQFPDDRHRYPLGLPPFSAPSVSRERVFVQTAHAQVMAFALPGTLQKQVSRQKGGGQEPPARLLWQNDLAVGLHVVPKNVGDIGEAIAQPLALGERVYVTTGNGGVASGHGGSQPNLRAPAFVALSAKDGSVLWQNKDPSPECSFYQNAGPFRVSADADPKSIGFPGGDGFLYLLDASTGVTLQKLRCFPKDSTPWTAEKPGTRNFFTIPPTVALPYVLTCPGWILETVSADRPRRRTPLYAWKMNGDRAATLAWTFDDERFLGTMSPLLVEIDEIFVLGYPDRLLVLDLATGRKKREVQLPESCHGHAGMAAWKDRLIVCLEDIHIFANDPQLTHLATLNAGEATSIFSQPVIQDDRLIVSTATTLWALDLTAVEKRLLKAKSPGAENPPLPTAR